MISALQRQPDGTIQLTVTIPFDSVKKACFCEYNLLIYG